MAGLSAETRPLLRIYLLGSFRVEREDKPIRWPRRKVELLLAYLALHHEPAGHSREKLAALLWGDSSDAQARHSLRTALTILRQHLGADLILAGDNTIQLNPTFPVWIDAQEFARNATAFLNNASPDTSDVNLALYQGELLTDFYDDWIVREREHYRGLYLETLLRLVQHYRAQSEYERAIEFARQVLTTDPANERAHQHLMFCYLALGNRPAALEQYEKCERALREELAVEPAPETTALYEWIRQTSAAPASRETRSLAARITNLPIPLSSFIGRQQEMKELKNLVQHTRLLTLVGAGGSGKTRLAIQVATDLIDSFKYGVWWVELAALSDPVLVPQQIARALGVRELANRPLIESLKHFLRQKRLLLVLDNCEHLIEACARIANELLIACPDLSILATSREALNLTGETLYHVPTLSVPQPKDLSLAQRMMQFEAVRLFVERAKALHRQFALTEQNALAVAEICQRLDGIPLAIELAAARTKVLTPEDIAARLDDRLNLLNSGSRAAAPRQQTLRATIDWSYDLLSEAERVLFRRLAVFAGGFALEAVENVCAGELLPREEILNLITHLVEKSLAIVNEQFGTARYGMLETIREYAGEKLSESGEMERVRDRHLEYWVNFAEEIEPKLDAPGEVHWLDRLEAENDNLRAALEWALRSEKYELSLRLASALGSFWELRRSHEGFKWLSQVISETPSSERTRARARVLQWAGRSALDHDVPLARAFSAESLSIARELGDLPLVARGLNGLGIFRWQTGDYGRARQCFEEALTIAKQLGDQRFVTGLLHNLANVARGEGDYATAQSLNSETLRIFRGLGIKTRIVYPLFNLGADALIQGDLGAAHHYWNEYLSLSKEVGNQSWVAHALASLATVAYCKGDVQTARTIYEQALEVAQQIQTDVIMGLALQGLGNVAWRHGDYEQAQALYQQHLERVRDIQIPLDFANALMALAGAALGKGDTHAGATALSEALSTARTLSDQSELAPVLDHFAFLALANKQPRRAARLFGSAAAVRDRVGQSALPPFIIGTLGLLVPTRQRDYLQATVEATRDQLGAEQFAAAFSEGQALSLEQAIEYASAKVD